MLWECVRDRRLLNAKFRRQHNLGQFIADFYCHAARLVIELDGEIHQSRKMEDGDRDQWMQSHGLTVLRFTNDRVFEDLEGVLGEVARVLLPSPLAPLPQGEGDKKVEQVNSLEAEEDAPLRLPSPSGRRAGDEGKGMNNTPKIICYLDNQIVPQINSSLKSEIDVSQAVRLKANLNKCFQGVIPVGKGFIVTEQQVNQWIKADPKNIDVLKLFSMGANLAGNPNGLPDRWIIDFNDMPIEDASEYKLPFAHVKANVKPERDTNRRDVRRINWWKFGENAPKMKRALALLSCYFAVPEVSKWAIFVPCPPEWLPGNKTKAVASNDFYVFGVLTSNVHRTWMHAQKSTLEDRTAYTHNTCFETFPFPQILPSPLAPLPQGEGDKRMVRLPSP
ncbi:endonuclease domain-containing protein [Microcoleus sp. FACHB-1515]|uniref:endonuclease domain-containing protein n=1 Tax=Microcoleus sp. FACHB-1515 TaxID=2692821 RepID=UPI0028C3E28E|nr:endonuclease domain-containing protein [Microcoleus sp. FACHB-1515]